MGEAHPRTMEGNWGSGGDVSWPVECLLNGMNTSDAHLMFGNGHNNHVLPPQFRHRFQTQPPPPMHISTGLPLSSSINVSIPSHPMVEENGQVQELNNVSSITGDASAQDRHTMTQSLPLRTNDVMDDTDGTSDDEEDDDDVDEEMGLSHARRGDSISHAHQMGDETLAQCQQQVPVRDNISAMISMPENHCHPKLNSNGILRNGLTVNEHSLQSHAHQPAPMMPLFSQMEEFGAVESQQIQGCNDPNSGYSVYGKMYFEGRIVLHLKQGIYNDGGSIGMNSNGGMNFASCSEAQKAQQFHGCAVCRLRSPATQENHRRKDSHRHTIRGVLFTFEDCTIVELYPDQISVPNNNPNDLKSNDQGSKICHSMPMNSYMTPSIVPQQEPHNPKQRLLQHMDMDQINVQPNLPNVSGPQPPPPSAQQHQKPPNQNEDHTSWWDEFESEADGEDELKETESTGGEESNQAPDVPLSSSCMNHKLSNNNTNSEINHITSDQHLLHDNTNDDDQDHHQSEEESCSQYVKYKCNICSNEVISRSQLESHICLNHTLNQNRNTTGSSIPPAIELDLSSSSNNNSNNVSFETNTSEERTVTTPNLTELDNRNELSSEENSCHSALNIITNDNASTFAEIKRKSNNSGHSYRKLEKTKLSVKYSCSVCSKTFHLKKTLKKHEKECRSTEDSVLKCSKCKAQFTDEHALEQHRCSVSYSKSNSIQKKKLKSVKINLRNRKLCNNDNAFTSTTVKKKFKQNRHHDHVEENDVFIGKKKKVSAKVKNKTQTGLTLQTPNYQPQQQSFSEEYNYYSSGQENNEENTSGSSTSESSQDDEYEDQNELEFNFKTKKKSESGPSSNVNSSIKSKKGKKAGAKYACELCGKCFSVERRLENHKLAHRTEKSSICEKCGKRFARKDKLMRHMFVHNEEKMFACHICDKRFSRRDKLSDHFKSHGTADEIHHCPMCKKEFLRPDILKQHVKLHGMEDKHQCPECLRFVTGKERLEKHMARHEEAKALGQTLLCPLCTKYFIQRQSLKAHIKKFHPGSHMSMSMDITPTTMSTPPPPLGDANSTLENSVISINSDMDYSKLTTSTNNPDRDIDENGSTTQKQDVYSCRQCPKQFARKLALKKHQRKHQHEHHLANSNSRILSQHADIEQMDDSDRNLLETPIDTNTNMNSNASHLHHSSILLSLASQMGNSSPLSTNSGSPSVSASIESTPSPAHTILPTQHPPTPPHLTLNSVHHHHHNQLSGLTSGSNAPPAHIPLSLAAAAAAVSVTPSIAQQNSLLGMSGHSHPGLHSHSSHHLLQHSHHANPQGLGHPGLSCSHGQMQHLSQHLSPLQHMNVGMTPPQSMFYAYSHYSYQ